MAVALLIATAIPAAAQFKIGPRIGVNVNKLHFNEETFHADNRAGFTGGIEAELMIPAINLGLDASVLYVRRSGQIQDDKTVQNVNRDYIDIPVYLKWKFGLPLIGKVVKPYLFTGPDFAFLTSRTAINDAWKNKKFDVAWNFGFGLEFFKHLQIGASYGLGMSKAAEKLGVTEGKQEIDGKNRYWTVTAAYLF